MRALEKSKIMSSDNELEKQMMTMELAIAQTRQITKLTERCWKHCSLKVSDKIDARSETCFVNCVDRFFDSAQIIMSSFENETTRDTQFL